MVVSLCFLGNLGNQGGDGENFDHKKGVSLFAFDGPLRSLHITNLKLPRKV